MVTRLELEERGRTEKKRTPDRKAKEALACLGSIVAVPVLKTGLSSALSNGHDRPSPAIPVMGRVIVMDNPDDGKKDRASLGSITCRRT